jgi:hypothetical protein
MLRHNSALWNRTKTHRHVGSYFTSYKTEQISCTDLSKFPQTLIKVSLQSEDGQCRQKYVTGCVRRGNCVPWPDIETRCLEEEQSYDAICLCIITVVTNIGISGHKTVGSGFDSQSGSWKFPSDIFLLSSYSSPGSNSVSSRNKCKEISLGESAGNARADNYDILVALNV